MRGHATGYGTAAVVWSASNAAGDVPSRVEGDGTDGGWGQEWPGRERKASLHNYSEGECITVTLHARYEV